MIVIQIRLSLFVKVFLHLYRVQSLHFIITTKIFIDYNIVSWIVLNILVDPVCSPTCTNNNDCTATDTCTCNEGAMCEGIQMCDGNNGCGKQNFNNKTSKSTILLIKISILLLQLKIIISYNIVLWIPLIF